MMQYKEALRKLGQELEILFVEDDPSIQNAMNLVLSRIFKKVHSASQGREALELFKQHPVDIVITDVEMPVMGGLQMSRELKSINPELPIVVVSAYTEIDYFLEAIESDVDYYVLKPINTDKFLQTLFQVCTRLEDQRLLKQFKAKELQSNLANERRRMLGAVSNSSPNPMIVYSQKSFRFSNQAFNNLLHVGEDSSLLENEGYLSPYLNSILSTDAIFSAHGNLLKQFALQAKETGEQKMALKTTEGSRVFHIIKTPVNFEDSEDGVIYTFNDITELIYQQIQLATYDKQISSLVEDNFLVKNIKNAGIINKVEFSD